MKKIGHSFYDELLARGGLVGEHFTWQDNGHLEFFDDTPTDVVKAVKSVYDNHDPTRPSIYEIAERASRLMATARKATEGMADAFVAGLLSDEEVAIFKAWAIYQAKLKAITHQKGYPQDTDWPVPPG